jgi:hypothetical protein
MLINIISPNAWTLWNLLCVLPFRKLKHNHSAVTQEQLNKAYTPERFEMPTSKHCTSVLFSGCGAAHMCIYSA